MIVWEGNIAQNGEKTLTKMFSSNYKIIITSKSVVLLVKLE